MDLHLKDKMPPRPHTIFVGINPAIKSATVGHYYAHESNHFWRLMAASGIAPDAKDATWDDKLVQRGFGFTDVVKRPTRGSNDLRRIEFSATASHLATIVARRKPGRVVFVSKTAARAFLGAGSDHPIKYGKQRIKFEGADVWFLPSTSGQSFKDTTLSEKLALFRRLARSMKKDLQAHVNS